MSLDKKIYLTTVLAAIVIAGFMAVAMPRMVL